MSIFRPSTLGTATNQITFNLIGTYPYYRIETRQPTRREIIEFDIKLPEGTGDADFQTHIGKTYLLITGTMYIRNETDYDNGRKALRKLASLEIQQEDTNSDEGYVPYKWTESDGYDKQLFLKVLYVDLPESTKGLKQKFRILAKIKYPVIFGQTAISANLGDATATISGSSGLPFGLPIGIGSTTYSSNGAITNPGDLPTYPTMTVVGPINTPRITNSTTGEYIEFNVNLASSSDSLVIVYDQDTIDVSISGNSVLSELTTGSTFFRLQPGINQLTLSGATVGSGAYATVSALPAWPLS